MWALGWREGCSKLDAGTRTRIVEQGLGLGGARQPVSTCCDQGCSFQRAQGAAQQAGGDRGVSLSKER